MEQEGADGGGGEEGGEDGARERAGALDGRFVGVEHQAAVGVGGDGSESGAAVERWPAVGEQQTEEAPLHEVARRLPEPDPRLGHGKNVAALQVCVHPADSGGNALHFVGETEPRQICRLAPHGSPFGYVAPHVFVG